MKATKRYVIARSPVDGGATKQSVKRLLRFARNDILLNAFVLSVLFLLFPVPLRAQSFNAAVDAAAPYPARGIVKSTLDVLEVRDMDIYEVLKRIAFQSGLEIVTDETVSARVTVYLKNIDVFDALRIILEADNLAYNREEMPSGTPGASGGTVHIMTAETFQKRFGYPFNQKIQTRIVPLEHAAPETVTGPLAKIKSESGKVIYSEGMKSFILLDTPEKIAALHDLIRQIDVPLETKTFELRYARAKDTLPQIEGLLTPNVGTIQPGRDGTALTITDIPANIAGIGRRLEELDKPAKTVALEVKILQIILNDENRRGVDWEAIVSEYQSLKFAGFQEQETAPGGVVPELGVGTVSEEDYAVLLDALDTVGILNTVSNFKMTDHEGRSEILIRSRDLLADIEAPPQEGMSGQGDVLYGVFSRLGENDQIVLDLRPALLGPGEPAAAAGGGEGVTLKLHEGTTVVIGGLFKQVTVGATRKIPVLGDLPIVGFAFRMHGQRSRTTEVIVFLTPKVVVKE